MPDTPPPLTARIDRFLAKIATPAYARQDGQGLLWHALAREPGLLTKAFNQQAVPDERHVQPALELAARFNLTSIGRTYRLPRGLTPARLEAYVLAARWASRQGFISDRNYRQRLREVYAALETLNPSLARLRLDRRDNGKVFDVALGVTSGFNPADMQFYLDGNYHYIAVQNRTYAARLQQAKNALGTDLYWVASPRTLGRIIAQRKR